MLLYPGIGTETMDDYDARIDQNGVEITILDAKEFNGEHNRRSWLYVLVMWLVSIWAAVTNFTQALFIKMFKKKEKFSRENSLGDGEKSRTCFQFFC